MTTIAPPMGSFGFEPQDVNDDGLVVGVAYSTVNMATLWTASGAVALGEGAHGSTAWAVSNGSPVLVGGVQQDAAWTNHPARWTVTLGATPSVTSVVLDDVGGAYGINDNGDMAGVSGSDAVIWPAAGGRTVVAPPAGSGFTSGLARDINNTGHVVGTFQSAAMDRAYLRLPDGTLVELPPQPLDVSTYARDVSEVGTDGSVFVAGTTRRSTYVFRAVRWTVDAATGAIRATRVTSENGSASSVSGNGDLGGSIEKRLTSKPTVWSDAQTFAMPLPRGLGSGIVDGLSRSGRFAIGRAFSATATAGMLWTR